MPQYNQRSPQWPKRTLFWAVVTLCFSVCIPIVYAQLFSPGKLTTSHKHLEGLSNCKKCHSGGRVVSSQACLKCHEPLRKQVQKKRGFHGRMSRKKLMKCESCHTEHKGRRFKIIYWKGGMKKFDHDQTGYKLHHKHSKVDCRKCHTSKFIQPTVRAYYAKWKRQHKTFLGLKQTCASCHKDPHRGQVTGDCKSCHSEKGFSPAHRFNHNRTRFALHNKHAKVACGKCHKQLVAGVKGALAFKISRACQSCHKDPHANKMTTSCDRCHKDTGWDSIHFAKATHAPRRFKLDGAHFKLDCAKCHGRMQRKVVRPSCKSCHKTPHSPSFPTDCRKCHNTTSWNKSNFSRAQHQKTRFPLHGKHMTVACNKCHKPTAEVKAQIKSKTTKGTSRFRMHISKFQNCTPCHKDVHEGQFRQGCKTCHNEEHFRPSLFGVTAHAKTRFPLAGAHLAVACNACHKQTLSSKSKAIRYHYHKQQNCQSCHKNPHKQKYKGVIQSKGCKGCHSEKTWTKIDFALFKHEMTGFALTGKHKDTKCVKCHAWKRRANGRVLPEYTLKQKTCAGCHTDKHFGQFDKGQEKADCQACHTTKEWKKATRFSHARARFKLTGAHKKVACAKCHKPHTLANQKRATLYRPIKHTKCINCHANHHEGKR